MGGKCYEEYWKCESCGYELHSLCGSYPDMDGKGIMASIRFYQCPNCNDIKPAETFRSFNDEVESKLSVFCDKCHTEMKSIKKTDEDVVSAMKCPECGYLKKETLMDAFNIIENKQKRDNICPKCHKTMQDLYKNEIPITSKNTYICPKCGEKSFQFDRWGHSMIIN